MVRAGVGDDFAVRDGAGVEVVDQEAVDDPRGQILDFGLVDLNETKGTLRVRLIHWTICDRLPGSFLDLCI